MGRAPCCSKVGLRRGPWTQKEDTVLIKYIQVHGEGNWRSLPKKAGLLRCGKSCRLRWKNYLRPDIKRGNFTPDEDDLILRFHSLLGNRWSLIAGRLPGRTDNEIKNYWNSHLSKTTTLKNNTRDPLIKKAPKRATAQPKNQEKNKHNATNKDITTNYTKVHYPKPVRVSSTLPIITNSCFNNEVSDHGEGDDEDEDEGDINNAHVSSLSPSWFDLSDGGEVMVFDENHDVVNYGDIACFDLSCQYHSPREDNMIENLYEEYQELLKADDYVQLDSFVESLLV